MYFNIQSRRIPTKKRKVLIAQEFTCQAEHQESVELILAKARRGEDLTPYQSRRIFKANAKDKLLFHWGIHHFHLRPEGTERLLFARVTPDYFYVIKFGGHGKWFDQESLRILHKNWPGSLERFRALNSIHGGDFSDREIENLVGKNANFIISVDGVGYYPLGGGTVGAGFNIKSIIQSDNVQGWIQRLEDEARNRASEILSLAKKNRWRSGKSLQLHLAFENGVPFCLNQEYGIRVRLRSQ